MPQKKMHTALPVDEVEDIEDDLTIEDADDPEDGTTLENPVLVKRFIRMWPRAIFNTTVKVEGHLGKHPTIASTIKALKKPGVYILYRDDVPFYVGQAKKLRSRLRAHARGVVSSKTYFWNYFSAFVVENPNHINEVEAILISAMPSVITNSSKPKLKMEPIGEPTRSLMRDLREKGHY
jgi:hypothetical protein